jgi:hypothetical protein
MRPSCRVYCASESACVLRSSVIGGFQTNSKKKQDFKWRRERLWILEIDLGTHTVFIGDVLSSETVKAGSPLTYKYYHQVLKGKSSPNAPTYESKK